MMTHFAPQENGRMGLERGMLKNLVIGTDLKGAACFMFIYCCDKKVSHT